MILGRNLYRHVLVAFAIAIFFTNVSDYTERYGAIPLFWIFVFGVVSLPAILTGIARGRITVPPLVWWCAGYLVISMASFYASSQDEVAFQEVQTRFISTIFLMLALIAFAKPAYQRLAQKWIAGAVLLATALNVYELFNPLTFSTIPGRSSGLYTNVNQSGAALVLGLILSYQVIPERLKLAYVAITAIGVIPTFSRAAMVGWLIVVGYFFLRAGLAAQLRQLAIISIACIGLLYSPLWGDIQQSLQDRGVLTLNIIERIAFFTGGRSDDASTDQRRAVAARAWELYGERPLTGWGISAGRRVDGYEVGTHNIYLAMLVDHGAIGFFIIPFLLLSVLWGLTRKNLDLAIPWLLFIVVWGMFSHNVLEERYILIAIALMSSIVASDRQRKVAPAAAWLPAPVAGQIA